jgi:hypothetical protein
MKKINLVLSLYPHVISSVLSTIQGFNEWVFLRYVSNCCMTYLVEVPFSELGPSATYTKIPCFMSLILKSL